LLIFFLSFSAVFGQRWLRRRGHPWSGGTGQGGVCGLLWPFFWSFPACLGRAAPAAGVQAQRPQRSEDERPGGWRGWRNT